MAIDTLADVKLTLGITGSADDALLGELQLAADAFIDMHCGRVFTGGTFTEYHPGGSRLAFLQNYPVAAVTSVKVDPAGGFGPETVRDPATYTVLIDRGVVMSKDGSFVPARPGFRVAADDFPRAVQVIYSTATGAVPAAVSRAYAELIGHWYRQTKTHAALNHQDLIQQTNGTTVTEYPWGLSGGFGVPKGVLQLLEVYRVPAAG
jgi:uncharacterized phiE125 gp8 family phage protein